MEVELGYLGFLYRWNSKLGGVIVLVRKRVLLKVIDICLGLEEKFMFFVGELFE